MLGLDIIFFVAIIMIFWKLSSAYTQPNDREGLGTRQTALLSTYAVSEKMLLYLDEAAFFAANEAYATTFTDGGKINAALQRTKGCGTYVGYELWTDTGTSCFPSTKTSAASGASAQQSPSASSPNAPNALETKFKNEMDSNLRRLLQYPGFPMVRYLYLLQGVGTDSISLTGNAQGIVRLPIIAVKDGLQSLAGSIIEKDNVAASQQGGFLPDTTIPGVIPIISPNRMERGSPISHIIIGATQTPDAVAATEQYTRGITSVHYLVDTTGSITQFVPEDQAALAAPPCDSAQCSIGGAQASSGKLDQESISIALAYPGNYAPKDGKCGTGDTLLKRTAWCGVGDSYKGITADCGSFKDTCWPAYQQAQLDALKKLVDDIVARRGIKATEIKLEEQVRFASDYPGPALHSDKQDEATFYKSLIIVKQKSVDTTPPPNATDAAVTLSDSSIPVSWPLDSALITSCFGSRQFAGRSEHFGIDLQAKDGDNVKVVADGTVFLLDDCDPSNCGDSGKNIIIKHSNTFYTRYSHLSQILVQKADINGQVTFVHRGDTIAKSGHTGPPTGAPLAPHLDLKVYRGSPNTQNAVNPLCLFPEEILQTKKFGPGADTCKKNYNNAPGPTYTNAIFSQECQMLGMSTHPSTASSCNINPLSVDTGGDKPLADTKKRLEAIKSEDGKGTLVDEISKAGQDAKIDYRIVISQIVQESGGNPNAIGPDGGVGISQFTDILTSKKYFTGLGDTNKIVDAPCRKPKTCTIKDFPSDDPRLNPHASVRAQTKLMADLINQYPNAEKMQFGLAAYNTGTGNMDKAIAAATKATGKSKKDLLWSDVSPYVSNITQKYIPNILKHYTALGGSVGSLYANQQCDQLTVKEMGTYMFKPSFTVQLPNLLASFDAAASYAKDIYDSCDGKGGMDNRDCFSKAIAKPVNNGLAVVPCDQTDAAKIAMSLAETIQDCRDNLLDSCVCVWRPPSQLSAKSFTIEPAGDTFRVLVDGVQFGDDHFPAASSQPATFQMTESDAAKPASVKYTFDYTNGALDYGGIHLPNDKDPKGLSTRVIPLYKKDGAVVWRGYQNNAEACGAYKTRQRLCIGLQRPIYLISKGQSINPVIKFALDLQDDIVPDAVKDLSANSTAVPGTLLVNFTASTSADISYYLLACSATSAFPDYERIIQGRDSDGKPLKDEIKLEMKTCNGKPVTIQGTYYVRILPVDISGNEGDKTDFDPTKIDTGEIIKTLATSG